MATNAHSQRAIVYVDGFNLYYGCVKGTQYRWLDLVKLAELMLPQHSVIEVKYFTAIVDSPSGSVRQQVYIGALESTGRVSTYRGHFLSHVKNKPRDVVCAQCGDRKARVIITEEKGTDVNLATHLVYDACTDAFDVAAVVSNDSDLVMPVLFARQKCGKMVGVLNPQKHPAQALLKSVDFYKKIRLGALAASQLPPVILHNGRQFQKPTTW
ncbi:MAG: NYN domain-containing protein [Actinomycetota bacterium]|nr:NYN domain-containing protein [Actinomycetota bacterium]